MDRPPEMEWFHPHRETCELFRQVLARLDQINKTQERLMSQFTDLAAKETADFAKVSADLDTIVAGVADLDAKIQALQNSQGQLGPDDQAALDSISAASTALVAKADGVKVS